MSRTKKRAALLVYFAQSQEIVIVRLHDACVYNRSSDYERHQIPRGTLNGNFEPSFIAALREFIEETHLIPTGSNFVYQSSFPLSWSDDTREWCYQTWIMIVPCLKNTFPTTLDTFVFKGLTPHNLYHFREPYIYFGTQNNISCAENCELPQPKEMENNNDINLLVIILPEQNNFTFSIRTTKRQLTIDNSPHCPPETAIRIKRGPPYDSKIYDNQYATWIISFEKFKEIKRGECKRAKGIKSNYEDFFKFADTVIQEYFNNKLVNFNKLNLASVKTTFSRVEHQKSIC